MIQKHHNLIGCEWVHDLCNAINYALKVQMSKSPVQLISAKWFGTADKNAFIYRRRMKNQGIPDHELHGNPIISIRNTWAVLTPCNAFLAGSRQENFGGT